MSTTPVFHQLRVARVTPEAAGAVAVTLAVAAPLRETFAFTPGQFVTVRTQLNGHDLRRSYSIASTRSNLHDCGEITLGIRPVQGGMFSNWATTGLHAGDTLEVMPPEGRFTIHKPRAIHRVGFAAGSGITPILSIVASTLQEDPASRFTLVYGNRSMASVMFNEALQNLKDRYADRLTLIHVLSRQVQEVPLLEGRIDDAKVRQLIATLLPVGSMDEVFICGPEAMIDATAQALKDAGVRDERIHCERFTSPTLQALSTEQRQQAQLQRPLQPSSGSVALTVIVDGKPNPLSMRRDQKILDVALAAGLDLPWSCRGGVCCTCRAKVISGSAVMEKNFTLEPWETRQGFVLSCQAQPTSDEITVSYDER